MTHNTSKIKGALIGSAIGDGFGYPTEFKTVAEIKAEWGENGLTAPLGEIIKVTDDTQMALAVSEALMRSYINDKLDFQLFELFLIEAFIKWLNDPENNRAPGMTCLTSCENLERRMPWKEATAKNSKGCGANMRVTPVPLVKFKHTNFTDTDIAKWSQFQSAVTHAHPTALAASDLTAIAILRMMEGISPESLLNELEAYCHSQMNVYHEDVLGDVWVRPGVMTPEDFISRGWQECLDVLKRLEVGIKKGDRNADPCDYTGEGWVAEESLATALLCFLQYPDEPAETLIQAVNTRGDSDSIACLAGAFAGARHGLEGFPGDWVSRIEYQIEMNKFVDFITSS
ncbi:MAG: ADP-ribosylglycohydrolase family protein [Bacteroidota bacterium]